MRNLMIRLGHVVTLSAILFVTVLDASPALAHGGPVRLSAGPDGAGGLTVFASYVEDGHPARGLALTATATAGTARRGPLTLRPAPEGEGFYVLSPGALPSGRWTVTVTGTSAQRVRAATTTVDVKAPGGPASPPVVTPTPIAQPKIAQKGASGVGRSSSFPLVAGGLAALTLVGGLSLLIARLRGSAGSAGEPPKRAPRSRQPIGRSR